MPEQGFGKGEGTSGGEDPKPSVRRSFPLKRVVGELELNKPPPPPPPMPECSSSMSEVGLLGCKCQTGTLDFYLMKVRSFFKGKEGSDAIRQKTDELAGLVESEHAGRPSPVESSAPMLQPKRLRYGGKLQDDIMIELSKRLEQIKKAKSTSSDEEE
uniref:Uncharacterized protein n=1 Tax=Mothra virus TaxID=1892236 RepID=A0A1L4FLJ9_9VIRU|nr:hypothetical protein [Mothra virus]